MATKESKELSAEISERGRVHTPWSGAVRMPDGQDYFGTVWRLGSGKSTRLYVYYQNNINEVRWDKDRYILA